MSTPYSSYLDYLLKTRGIGQAELGRRLHVDRQQVHKWCKGRRIDPDDARKIAPIFGIEWSALLDGKPPQEVATAVEEGVAVGKSSPARIEPVDDIDELALIDFWRTLSRTKKAALFSYLGMDDLPSLREIV